MQIISELEGYRRGPYAGASGTCCPTGRWTLHRAADDRGLDGVARLQAGAGVVADSEPEAEHRECLAKLAALEAAIELAEVEYA
jgi:anthranilate synthase component 1